MPQHDNMTVSDDGRQTQHFARDLRLSRAFRSPSHQASVGLLRTASCLRNRLDRITKERGISISQFNVLRILRGSGKPLQTMEIANRMVEVEPGITRLLVKLERNKLISRKRGETDGRSVECAITLKGLQLLDQLDGPVAGAEEEIFARLSKSELASINTLLARLHERSLDG